MSIYDDLEISRRCPNCGASVADADEELGYVIYFCGGSAIPGGDVEGCTGPTNEEGATHDR